MWRSLLREPLVQFLVLGAALFALDAWLRPRRRPLGIRSEVLSVAGSETGECSRPAGV